MISTRGIGAGQSCVRDHSLPQTFVCTQGASANTHIYPPLLQALAGRGVAGCGRGGFRGYRGGAMHDPACELPRIPILRGSVNRSKKERRRRLCSEGEQVPPKRSGTQAKAPPERGLRGEQENLPSCTDGWAR